MLSAAPRSWAASSGGRSRAGLGSLTREPDSPGGSGPKPTVRSSRSAIARNVEAVARLKISVGEKACAMLLHQGGVDAGLGQFGPEAALIVFGHGRPFRVVAFVEEGQPKREGEIAEDAGVFGPGHHRARRHHGRYVAVHEPVPGQIGERDHRADPAAAVIVVVV